MDDELENDVPIEPYNTNSDPEPPEPDNPEAGDAGDDPVAEEPVDSYEESEERYIWYAVTDTNTPPSEPDTEDTTEPVTGWTTTRPIVNSAASAALFAWTCTQIVHGDNSCDWGEVELFDLYEVEKRMWIPAAAAQMVADATNQHFWTDSIGIHITEITQDAWSEDGGLNQNSGMNALVNSLGQIFRDGLMNLAAITRSAVAFYDGLGNLDANIIASFGADGAQIGKNSEKHAVLNSSGLTVYNSDGTIAPIVAYLSGSYITDSSITNSKIADSTITGSKIVGSTLTDIPYAEIDALKARNITADSILAATSFIAALVASSITANDISADHATIGSLSTNYAHITNGVIDNAKIGHVDVNGLSANYAEINMANVNNAWLQNGIIKDAAISDGMINSVSANKLTAGTIDASNITVTNLNADNITTGTINGQRIGEGSLSLDKLADDVYTETEVDGIVQNLQTQIDGAIETWTGTTIPTLQNSPASNWATNSVKDTHVGDVYFVVNQNSDQNGYNYRFTKINNTYSWQLIKDNDVTQALQRLTTAEGKIGTIEQFDSTISSWKTDTDAEISSIKSAATTLAGRVTTAEGDIATKVDTTTFNQLSQTVDTNSSSITQLTTETTAITEKITFGKPYKEVEWVESDGHQFVQLDWIPNLNGEYGFEIDFENYNTRNTTAPAWNATSETNRANAGFILGARDAASVSGKQFVLGCYTPGYLFVGTSTNHDPHMYYDGRRQQCSYHNGVYTAPDGQTYNYPCGTVHPRWGMVIFALSNNATKSATYFPSSTKLYSCKFYDDDILAVDLVGAIRTEDGMTGLYDKVADKFWACAGLGTGEVVGELGEAPTLMNRTISTNPILIDTKTKGSRLWTADAPMLDTLEDGQQITLRVMWPSVSEAQSTELAGLADSGAAYNVYLKLTLADGSQTAWEPCYYGGATRITTHYGAGTDVHLTYHQNRVFGTSAIPSGWWADANYDSNSNDTARLVQWYNNIFAKKALRNASIIVGDSVGYEEIGDNVTFDLSYPILWRTAALAINKTDYQYSWTLTYDRTLATCYPTVSGTKNQILYLVGEPSGGNFTIKSPILTFTTPTEPDNLYYIPIGKLGNQSNGQNYLVFSTAPNPTMFAYIGDSFQQVQSLVVRTTTRLNETVDTVSEHSRRIGELETTVETKADGSSVTTISNRLNTLSDTVDGHTQTISEVNSTISGLNTRVQTAESTIQQHAGDIQLKANASDTYTKQATEALLEVKANKDTLTSEINASADTVKIDASRVEINGPAIFSSISNSVDNAISTQLAPVSTAASNASDAAATALQTALDGAFLTISSTNGILFKNGAESTILQVIIFPNGGTKCETIQQVRDRFGSTAYIEWQWKHESTGEWGTLLSNDSHLSQGGMWLTVTPTDVATKTTFSASLVVPD